MVREIKSKAEFETELSSAGNKLLVVDFTASWCGPCQRIKPVLEEMARENADVVFIQVDVDENKETTDSCEISCMPTFQFYKDGAKIEQFSGANKDMLLKTVNRLK